MQSAISGFEATKQSYFDVYSHWQWKGTCDSAMYCKLVYKNRENYHAQNGYFHAHSSLFFLSSSYSLAFVYSLEENNKDTPNDRMVFCDKSEMYWQNVIHNGTEQKFPAVR